MVGSLRVAPDVALAVEGARARRGRVLALRGVSVHLAPGELVAVLGPNGAGKSTLLLAISGVVPLEEGTVQLTGERIDHLDTPARVRRGLGHIPQGRHLFPDLTVRDHLLLAARFARGSRCPVDDVDEWLDRFAALRPLADTRAGWLSGGEQQLVAVARTLIGRPRLVLADEPMAGLAAGPRLQVIRELRGIADRGGAVLVVEQEVETARSLADRYLVLVAGRLAEEHRVR